MTETVKRRPPEKEITVEGHLVDSMILTKIWDRIARATPTSCSLSTRVWL
jgi:hypothetical protein